MKPGDDSDLYYVKTSWCLTVTIFYVLCVHHVVSCCFACFIVFSFSLLEAIALEEEEMSFWSVPLVQESKKNHSLWTNFFFTRNNSVRGGREELWSVLFSLQDLGICFDPESLTWEAKDLIGSINIVLKKWIFLLVFITFWEFCNSLVSFWVQVVADTSRDKVCEVFLFSSGGWW